jgi:uncharacterized protein YejL (UPF0352 family)
MIVISHTTIIIPLLAISFFLLRNNSRDLAMPQQSRYSDTDFEALMNELILTLEQHQADRDLSLMVLGNVITHIFKQQVPSQQRTAMAEQYAKVLLKSING